MIKIVMVDKSVLHIWDMHEGDYFMPTGSDSIMLKTGQLRDAVEIKPENWFKFLTQCVWKKSTT